MKNTKFDSNAILTLFRENKIATMDELKTVLCTNANTLCYQEIATSKIENFEFEYVKNGLPP